MARKPHPMLSAAREILKRPYGRVILPEDSGNFFGEIVEFPGCFSAGSTAAEALSNLEEVAESWLLIELEKGHAIPQPMGETEYSGKLVLRIPKALHRKAAWAAEREGASLNQFIATNLAQAVGERSAQAQMSLTAVQFTAVSGPMSPLLSQIIPSLQQVRR
jgi:predicted RNase H-like HicB family nuclease